MHLTRWNRKTLLAACEAVLRRPDTRLLNRTLKEPGPVAKFTGNIEPNDSLSNVTIYLDPSRMGLVEGALHETLHVVLNQQVGGCFNEALEEVIMKALERDLWIKVLTHRRFKTWRKLVNGKLQL